MLEDWVRAPISQEDLLARMESLRARARRHLAPVLHAGSVLQFGPRSVVVSPTEAELLDLLTTRFRTVVPREALRAQISDPTRTVSRNALDLHIKRLRRRIAPLDLVIRTAWGSGYLLDLKEGVAAADEQESDAS
jgi:DNA-binding response OmpR family regulator